jgi:hypothetical protein
VSENIPYTLVALLDVLGYRERLSCDRESGRLDFKDALQKAMQVLSDVNETEYAYQAISDTIIIASTKTDNLVGLLRVLKDVQLAFLREGLLVRGGVAYERHFKSNNITYSHALAIAHQIENTMAIVPRVVVDINVIELERPKPGWSALARSQLIYACNGVYFLNILGKGNWKKVYAWVRKIYERDRESLIRKEKEFMKHVWMENMLFASPYAQPKCGRYIPTARAL